MLFNIYVNDLFEIMNNNNDSDVFLIENEQKINALMYADDLIIISESKEGLQKQINKLEEYCAKWKLNINNKKTKVMIFNRGNKLINNNFQTSNGTIENVKEFKYLTIPKFRVALIFAQRTCAKIKPTIFAQEGCAKIKTREIPFFRVREH